MVIVNVIGGLGSQMFQYAAGHVLALSVFLRQTQGGS